MPGKARFSPCACQRAHKMTDGPHIGGCLCGAVTYEAQGKTRWIAHCHCNSCRRSTGAPITTYVCVESSSFRWSGEAPARFNSSPGVFRAFCPTCGTPLAYEAEQWPGETHLHISTLEDPDRYPPTAHVYTAERISWFECEDGLRRLPANGTV